MKYIFAFSLMFLIASIAIAQEKHPLLQPSALPDGALARMGSPKLRVSNRLSAVAISQDASIMAGSYYYQRTGRRKIVVFDGKTGLLNYAYVGPGADAQNLAISPDGKFIAGADFDREGEKLQDVKLYVWQRFQASCSNRHSNTMANLTTILTGREIPSGV